MKLINIMYNSEPRIAKLLSDESALLMNPGITMMDIIKGTSNIPSSDKKKYIESKLEGKTVKSSEYKILAPIPEPVRDVICVGLNYKEHILESQSVTDKGGSPGDYTTYFGKRADKIRGTMDVIQCPMELDSEVDYEVELTIIIGKKGKNIKKENALEYVFGYTSGNDLSSRMLQRNHKQWYLGKGIDGYTSMGPAVKLNLTDEHQDFNLISRVNGEIRQNSNTKFMIKSIEEIIQELSKSMTLFPGDMIMTGTPAGVGMGFNPQRFLKPGDKVECEIEGIGVLTNFIENISEK